jgi:hypothetical protein
MADSNAFTLSRSTLNPFLFEELATEANGAGLTMLSVLARLDRDPWAEAARLVGLPAAAKIDQIAAAIRKMPLSLADLTGAHAIAERLALLLPTQVDKAAHQAPSAVFLPGGLSLNLSARSSTVLILCFAVGFGMLANVFFAQGQHAGGSPPPAAAAQTDSPAHAPVSE